MIQKTWQQNNFKLETLIAYIQFKNPRLLLLDMQQHSLFGNLKYKLNFFVL